MVYRCVGLFLGSLFCSIVEENGNPLQYSCQESPMDSWAEWLQRVGHNLGLSDWTRNSSVPLIHMYIFMPIPHYFNYCSFVVLSKVWEGYASSFLLFPQNCFGRIAIGLLLFHIYFRIICSSSMKNVMRNLISISLDL